ncbi:MAG: chemotaxis protein CheC, partial [Oscillospiraceae bacterium]
MSNEENTNSEKPVTVPGFGETEMDAIGEIENITMGSAATAVSNLLNAKVWITTPKVKVVEAKDLIFPNLEPSVRVSIEYIKGVSGSSILVLKQSDVQLILDQLMGLPLVETDDFEFDEMNISAVCEVM